MEDRVSERSLGHCGSSAPAQYFRFPSWSLLGSQTSTFLGILLNSQKWEATFPPGRACFWGNRQIGDLPLKQSWFGLLLSPRTETVLEGEKNKEWSPAEALGSTEADILSWRILGRKTSTFIHLASNNSPTHGSFLLTSGVWSQKITKLKLRPGGENSWKSS